MLSSANLQVHQAAVYTIAAWDCAGVSQHAGGDRNTTRKQTRLRAVKRRSHWRISEGIVAGLFTLGKLPRLLAGTGGSNHSLRAFSFQGDMETLYDPDSLLR